MKTIIIKPKSKEEQNFLSRLMKKMNVEVSIVEEPSPNYDTIKAMEDVHLKKGVRVKDSNDLFAKLGI